MNRIPFIATILFLLIALAVIALWWRSTPGPQPDSNHDSVIPTSSSPTNTNIIIRLPSSLDGAELAQAYCTTCHLFPSPDLLDRSSWIHGALPEMRPWLGLSPPPIEKTRDGRPVILTNLFPTSPILATQDWNRIIAYYAANAPESLGEPSASRAPLPALTQFKVAVVPYIREVAMVSMVRIDAGLQRYLIGDAMTRTLEAISSSGEHEFTVEFGSGPIDLRLRQEGLDVLLPGRLFPSDQLKGSFIRLSPGTESMDMTKILDELRRPTAFEFADLNGDNREDVVICQFGHRLGQLSWFEQLPNNQYREHLLLERAGATSAQVRDFDSDGRPDILVVMAQAWEGVSLFRNVGNSQFEERKIVEQPPTFGYAGLEVMDWDGNGTWDFVTVNGDNGEYSAPVKPYHGIRLYLNNGQGSFQESWFEPLPGAYQIRVRDFDLDGDLDLAAISYFPDYEGTPSSGFVYLQNQGKGTFSRSSFAQSTVGRWISMDAGDIDGDGDEDLILGSLVRGPDTIPIPAEILESWKGRSPPVLLLKNQAR